MVRMGQRGIATRAVCATRWILAGAVVQVAPLTLSAQASPAAVEIHAGWQEPLANLRSDDGVTARRTGALSLGLSILLHTDRPLLWRLNGDVTESRISTRVRNPEPPSEQSYSALRREYAVTLEGALRIGETSIAGRPTELRIYAGPGLRAITTDRFACNAINSACLALSGYQTTVGAVLRVGLISTMRTPSNHIRLDAGFQLSKPWHRFQHDVRIGLRIG